MSRDETPIADLLQAAWRWHDAGQPDAAQIMAQRILARDASHPEALTLLARLRPIHVTPEQAPAPQVLAAAGLNNRGVAESGRGDAEGALASYTAALALDPNHADAWSNRGNSLLLARRIAEAVECYDRAIALRPGYGAAYANRGLALQDLGRMAEAVADYDRALALLPDLVSTLVNRGNALLGLKQAEAALDSYRRAAILQPDLREAANGIGAALAALDRLEEALAEIDRALALSPDFVEALVNRGAVLHRLGRLDDALVVHDYAIALREADAVGHFNRATTLMELRRCRQALDSFGRAQELRPDHVEAHWNESLCRLILGDYVQGWRKHEWGWAANQRGFVRNYGSQSRLGTQAWTGDEPIAGTTLLLHAEQGMGDTLQFCRYAALARESGAQVILEVQEPLVRLLRRMPEVAHVVATGAELPPFDRHSPMLSTPLAFATTLETVPARIPYLHADPAATARWRARLAACPGPRIGLVWAGGPRPDDPVAHKVDQRRSMRLAQMGALAAIRGVTFVSLQKGVAAAQAAMPPHGMTLLDWTEELQDFADTADLVAALDLVISVDTAVVHLAGGLGCPVWVLSRHDGCWRWLLERSDSPWYPTARLFRQPSPGDWNTVMANVVDALDRAVATRTFLPREAG